MARRQRHLTSEDEGKLVREFEAQTDRAVTLRPPMAYLSPAVEL
jgi:hypothetical protein